MFIVLGTYNFVSISTNLTGGIRWVVYDIVVRFWKMYISSLSCKSTMYYWWIISSASVSPHSSIVVNFSVFPAILQGPPRQSVCFYNFSINKKYLNLYANYGWDHIRRLDIFNWNLWIFNPVSVLMRYRPYFRYIFKCLLLLEKFKKPIWLGGPCSRRR